MAYTVQQLARLAGVSARTLRFYDSIHLLSPSHVGDNGYRYYEHAELVRLQQILFFRELDFSLDDIKRMMHAPGFDVLRALRDQQHLLRLKRKRLDTLIRSIDHTITSMQQHTPPSDETLYDAFKDDDVKAYQAEVKERWGNTDAYKHSMEKVRKMTKQQMEELKARTKDLTQRLADAMDLDPASEGAQALVAQHHAGIEFFYPCSMQMYRGLGQMYVDDPRFTAYYDAFRPGLAVWLRDAITVYCDTHAHMSS